MLDTILNVVHYIGSFLLIISVIVFIHEFGHYWVARRCGVRVEEFAFGFGKELFGRTDKHGTRWKFCLLPLGGYVKMFGDADPSSSPDAEKIDNLTEEELKTAFHSKKLYQKAAVVAAGPAANFILAILIFTFFFTMVGRPLTQAVVGQVVAGSAAESAGVQSGDRFLTFGGADIKRFTDLQRITRMHPGEELQATLIRDGKEITLTITPTLQESKDVFGNSVKIGLLGIASGPTEHAKLSLPDAFVAATEETYQICADTLKALGQMITGNRSVDELGGPIKIAQYSGQSMQQGWETVIWFMALLSVNLGLINLFPIPMLDGGHLMFYTIEAMSGRPLASKIQEYAFKFGFAVLISLMAFTTINDIIHIF